MASRKKRKRDRRRAEANAASPNKAGWGQGVPLGRRDVAMIRQAIRERWPVPSEVRRAVADDVHQLLVECLLATGAEANPHFDNAVVSCLIEMEGDNQRRELLTLAQAERAAKELAARSAKQPQGQIVLYKIEEGPYLSKLRAGGEASVEQICHSFPGLLDS